MRILAIRGKNLASLGGEFALELNQPPLSEAGLFAITGPTGAGKSTILDAACLALFNRTPRLSNHGGVGIGESEDEEADRLASNDARSLLRHGTAEGYAEVDFTGIDGRAYRTRWCVRRARSSARGRMQEEELTLTDLATGRAIGSLKKEVLEEIEQRLGLSYDQFTRSALLAQGDFAQFLKAGADVRAELLEKLTGTGLYSVISRKAFERAKEAKAELQGVEQGRARLQILAPEERKEKETGLQGLQDDQKKHKDVQGAAAKAVQWHDQRTQLAAKVEEAEKDADRAEKDRTEAASTQVLVDRVASVQTLRGPLNLLDTRTQETAVCNERLAGLTAKTGNLREALNVRQHELARAEEMHTAAEKALQDLAPELDKARRLDGEIKGAEKTAAEDKKKLGLAEAEAEVATKRLTAAESKAGDLEAAVARAEEWFTANKPRRVLAEGWNRWEPELEAFGDTSDSLDKVIEEARRQDQATTQAGVVLKDAREGREDAKAQLEAAKKELKGLADAVGDSGSEAAAKERGALIEARDLTKDLLQILENARDAAEAEEEARRERAEAEAEAKNLRQSAQQAKTRLAELEPELKEAKSNLSDMEAARSLDEHRKDLKPGLPCPLCGSLDHPRAAEAPVAEGAITRLRARVRQLEKEVEALRETYSSSQTAAKQSSAEAKKAATREKKQTGLIQAAIKNWKGGRPSLVRCAIRAGLLAAETTVAVVPESPLEKKAEAVLKGLAKQAADRLDQLSGDEKELARSLKLRDKAQGTVDKLREAFGKAESAIHEADRTLVAQKNQLDALTKERTRLEKELDRWLRQLEPAIDYRRDWRDAIRVSPARFTQACRADVLEWKKWDDQAKSAGLQLQEQRPLVAAAKAEASSQDAGLAKARSAFGQSEQAMKGLKQERAGALGGQDASEAEKAQKLSIHEAKDGRDHVFKLSQAESAQLAQMDGELRAAGEQAKTALAKHGAAQSDLQGRLQVAGIDLETLRGLLAHDDAWIAARRREMLDLKERVTSAQSVLRERRQILDDHEKSGRPLWEKPKAETNLEAAKAALQRIEGQAVEVRLSLLKDDKNKKESAELGLKLEGLQKQADIWQAMSNLIGSADGKKFRVYVQSLTLEILLAEANAYLKDLAPRYRMRRVPGSDMDLMVTDQDMGEEVRSINSLSGGESFLVSLALALGLSSLSARDTHVGSLFIDEGFGSLDPRSLETALSVLDSLQATGRQIGVISHVSSLAESIGYKVRVRPRGNGRSAVEVCAGAV